MIKEILKPDYIFETSWEICNKVGGIYTVISTKAHAILLKSTAIIISSSDLMCGWKPGNILIL